MPPILHSFLHNSFKGYDMNGGGYWYLPFYSQLCKQQISLYQPLFPPFTDAHVAGPEQTKAVVTFLQPKDIQQMAKTPAIYMGRMARLCCPVPLWSENANRRDPGSP